MTDTSAELLGEVQKTRTCRIKEMDGDTAVRNKRSHNERTISEEDILQRLMDPVSQSPTQKTVTLDMPGTYQAVPEETNSFVSVAIQRTGQFSNPEHL
jgi:hypothetical protein